MGSDYALITGCSDGSIGSALAREFLKHGVNVFATARDVGKMSSLKEIKGIKLLPLDVTSSTSIAEAVETVKVETGGKLKYLVNNAGGGYTMPTLDADLEKVKKMYDVNVFGVVAVTQGFAPLVIAAKGAIVNISSVAGVCYPAWTSLYAASKAALTSLSESLRLEMAPLGVRVVTVQSGAVDSNFFTYQPDFKLPANSQYKLAEQRIAQNARGEDLKVRMSPEEFATKVVGDVLSGTSGKIWRGKMASFIKFGVDYFPTSMIDKRMNESHGLNAFRKALEEQNH